MIGNGGDKKEGWETSLLLTNSYNLVRDLTIVQSAGGISIGSKETEIEFKGQIFSKRK